MSEVIFTAPTSGLYSCNEEIFFELSNGDKYVGIPKVHLDALRVRVDELEKENQKLKEALNVASAEIKELKAKLEKAESVISFYASEDTWINKEFDEKNNLIGWTQKKPNDVSIFPYSIGNSNGNFHCLGRKARAYLKGEG